MQGRCLKNTGLRVFTLQSLANRAYTFLFLTQVDRTHRPPLYEAGSFNQSTFSRCAVFWARSFTHISASCNYGAKRWRMR